MTHLFEKSRAVAVGLVVTVVGLGPVREAMAATPSFPSEDPSEQSAALAAQQEMLSDLKGKLAAQSQLLHAQRETLAAQSQMLGEQRKVLAVQPHVAASVQEGQQPSLPTEP